MCHSINADGRWNMMLRNALSPYGWFDRWKTFAQTFALCGMAVSPWKICWKSSCVGGVFSLVRGTFWMGGYGKKHFSSYKNCSSMESNNNSDIINYYLQTVVVCLLHLSHFFRGFIHSWYLKCIATIKQKLSSEQKSCCQQQQQTKYFMFMRLKVTSFERIDFQR